jgi:hypothetical protein
MYKFPYTLTLTPEGFQLIGLGRSRRIAWNNIDYFQIKKDTIVWSYKTSYSKRSLSNKINRSFMGFDDNLPKNFEIEPEDLVTLLGEWQRKHTTGHTYAADITEEEIALKTTEFIDANPSSITSYGLTWMFIIFPIALLVVLITSKPSAKIFVMVMVVLCFIFIFLMFILQRKFYVSKIITNDKGLVFNGLLKKFDIQWHEILSIGLYSTAMGEIKTRKGNFLFPLSMKDKYKAYPKMSKLFSFKSFTNGLRWIDSQGNEKPITLENCPLYEEIQINLKKTPKSSLVNEPITESKEKEIMKKGMAINWVIWAFLFL